MTSIHDIFRNRKCKKRSLDLTVFLISCSRSLYVLVLISARNGFIVLIAFYKVFHTKSLSSFNENFKTTNIGFVADEEWMLMKV